MKKISGLFFFLLLIFLVSPTNSKRDSCNSVLNLGSRVSFNTTSLNCLRVWRSQNFYLRFRQNEPMLWSFVLSTPNSNAYVAIGFSTDGKMVGTSAIVGWNSGSDAGVIKQYFMRGDVREEVLPDQGSLQIVNNSMFIISQSSTLYLAFQLRTSMPLPRPIYSVGPENYIPSTDYLLVEHRHRVSTFLDYSGSGSSEVTVEIEVRRHGLLNMIGWGILIPIGIIMARYFKRWDPFWFYSHIAIQGLGFALGIAGMITGLKLSAADVVDKHRALGITIIVLGSLQVMAVLGRPDKQSKIRKYWNWYHHTLGRSCIAIAIANVFYGIHIAEEGREWKIGYGVSLGVLAAAAIILEVYSFITRKKG